MDFDIQQTPITIALIVLNVLFSLVGFSNGGLVDKTIMWPYRVLREKQYYRFISSGFLHGDYLHLFFNMFTLFFFGRFLELYLKYAGLGGAISYLSIYLTGLIVSDIPTFIKYKNVYGYRTLGASGAVSAIIFATIVINPWSSIYLYGAIKISAALYAVLYIIYSIQMSKRGHDNVNHDAHLWGAVWGAVFMIVLIAVLQPQLFAVIKEELMHPSLFGNG